MTPPARRLPKLSKKALPEVIGSHPRQSGGKATLLRSGMLHKMQRSLMACFFNQEA